MEISYSPLVLKQSHYYAGGEFIIYASNVHLLQLENLSVIVPQTNNHDHRYSDIHQNAYIIHLVSKYLLRAYYVPGTLLGCRQRRVNKQNPCQLEAHI